MKKERLLAIDGLKGIAILAVVFTHIPPGVWSRIIPSPLATIGSLFFNGGGVGVTIFFITTGFLMGLLYPKPQSALHFYARRYARLFPAFLTMVTSFTLLRLVKIPKLFDPIVVVAVALLMRFFWKKGSQFLHPGGAHSGHPRGVLRLANSQTLNFFTGKKLIIAALTLQGLVAFGYAGFLLRVPSSVFYLTWSETARTLITFIVNATFTLPFGNYIDQLDGIYWALTAEVLFYLLYPILIAPLMQSIKGTSRLKMVALFILLLPFCFGLSLAAKRVLGFGMLQIQLVIYFIIGVGLGMNLTTLKKKFESWQTVFAHPVWILGLLIAVFSSVVVSGYIAKPYVNWLAIVMVVPTALLIISAVVGSVHNNTLLTAPFLTFFGKYSYALFLTHSLIIHSVQKYIATDTVVGAILMITLVLLGTIVLSKILYYLLERPYFVSRKKSTTALPTQKTYAPIITRRTAFGLTFAVLLLTYIAFRVPVAFFTTVVRHGAQTLIRLQQEKTITVTDQPFQQPLVAQADSLGMILTHVKKEHVSDDNTGFKPFLLFMRLRDNSGQVISESSYHAYEILDDPYHPFGFPVQNDSRGKNYTFEYQLSETIPTDEIEIVADEYDFFSVYFPNKKELLANPSQLISWLTQKFAEPFALPMFWLTVLHVGPFLIILFLSQLHLPMSKRNV
ncbi:acyltransferase [Candidatus Microgenomates bacterium]|nr:MAG: acyltransferase [Candidatus Microgenomates bacterium]